MFARCKYCVIYRWQCKDAPISCWTYIESTGEKTGILDSIRHGHRLCTPLHTALFETETSLKRVWQYVSLFIAKQCLGSVFVLYCTDAKAHSVTMGAVCRERYPYREDGRNTRRSKVSRRRWLSASKGLTHYERCGGDQVAGISTSFFRSPPTFLYCDIKRTSIESGLD